jgi:BirA family biotin operon repressor/biotin-[acetyl-CoA-carboxylase] ligase
MPAYGKLSLTLGRRVTVIADSETYDAQAESIGGSGELIVRMDDGARRSVWAADVSVRLNKDA